MRHETFEQLVARVNAGSYVPPLAPTGAEKVKVMAQKVKLAKGKEFTFASAGQASKYPWDEWLSGDLLLLEKDAGDEKKDFDVDVDAMPAKIKFAARRRYKVVQISRRDADGKRLEDALIIRARDMDDAERQAEDVLRAEEKEALKARREKDKAEANGTGS